MNTQPRVLIVDDDADTRDMYAWSLEARGFAVVPAGTVSQAAKVALARPPDVIVTDFTLPGEDGLALAARVRDSRTLRDTPMVLVSGRAFVGGAGGRAAALFDRVLLKPVLPDQLIAEIVPLLLDRTAATLQRQLRAVRARVAQIPHGSAAGRVLSAVREVTADGAPAALLADSSAHYIGANDAACDLTGRSREELLSLSLWDLTPPTGMARTRREWVRFVQIGSGAGAYRLEGPAGTAIPATFAASANVLPGCHLSLLQPLHPALIQDGLTR